MLGGSELRDYQKFGDEIIYQDLSAWKATQRHAAQLARHCTPAETAHPVHLVSSPAKDVPMSIASHSFHHELSPAPAPHCPSPAVRHPALFAHHDCAVSVLRQDHTASVVCHVRPAPVVYHTAPIVRHV